MTIRITERLIINSKAREEGAKCAKLKPFIPFDKI